MSDTEYSVEGTPTDCVIMALNHLFPDKKPDLVLSGVNRGGNLGEDVLYSGTVAAASEGTLLGVKAIALCQCIFDVDRIFWETAEELAPDIIRNLLKLDWGQDTLMNINFPAIPANQVKGTVVTRQGKHDLSNLLIDARTDARGRDYFWLGYRPSIGTPGEGTDLFAVNNSQVSVTPLKLNLTDDPLLDDLKNVLG